MASDGPSSDKNAQRAFGLYYLTEEKSWNGRTTTYRDIWGNVVGTSYNHGDRTTYHRPDGSLTWNGNDSSNDK